MNESQVTVVGNVATPVEFRRSAAGLPTARFRLASTVRRYDQRSGGWADAFTNFYTVWAWRSLAANLASSVTVGEPLVVTGQLRIRQTERDGRQFASADLTATAVGHDLSRGTSAFVRTPSRSGPRAGPGRNAEAPGGSSGAVTGGDVEAVIPRQGAAP
ncbi:single-strand DNA-binding protein [Streptomyces sp. WMMB 714]|uniref:single-stranded DNA-binding protein n=1 Tax=Streptomyces sp. WMMB 714 TaxID=1286822 RepID=UPI0005F848DA|nr:single-stranded DNA-binding protein [Streptomyces sp. WMMB 714]SCK20675.1 single-strand DNA-binding protein [Streptomyces sp. WMMB 714]